MTLAWHIGWRYLRTRPVALLSVVAVACAVTIAYVPSPVLDGFLAFYREKLRQTAADVQVDVVGVPDDPRARDAITSTIASVPGVQAVAQRADWLAAILTDDPVQSVDGILFVGVEPIREATVTPFAEWLDKSLADPADPFRPSAGLVAHELRWRRAADLLGADPSRAAAVRKVAEARAVEETGAPEPEPHHWRAARREAGEAALRTMPFDARAAHVAGTVADAADAAAGWDPAAEQEDFRRAFAQLEQGQAGPPGLVVGRELLRQWPTLRPGGRVTLFTARGTGTGRSAVAPDTRPTSKEFLITGVASSGFHDWDRSVVSADLRIARAFLTGTGAADTWTVRGERGDEAPALRDRVRAALRPLVPDERDVRASTWLEKRAGFLQAVELQRSVLLVILFLAVVVAGFGILVTLWVLVAEKTRDIGILMALGGSPRAVGGLYVWTGLLLGTVGAVAGVAVGYVIVQNADAIVAFAADRLGFPDLREYIRDVQHLAEVPVQHRPWSMVRIVLATLAAALVFSALPAWRAARLDPVRAIRRE